MALGSRPARRGSVEPRGGSPSGWVIEPTTPAPGIESLRAIPWVFSWSQRGSGCRLVRPRLRSQAHRRTTAPGHGETGHALS